MKISTYALHTVMALAATATFTMAQATMKNACGSNGQTMKNACGPHGKHMNMKKSGGTSQKGHMKNACGS